ncbi:unnamed protein product [Nezara viridula]|uniref:Uncharacterized protein n=1 Tax=Nezara viridula TaxID=85310 RepID=A0A9P0HU13_NEZVI|nr:unnamed protein product [Nezara viridula]
MARHFLRLSTIVVSLTLPKKEEGSLANRIRTSRQDSFPSRELLDLHLLLIRLTYLLPAASSHLLIIALLPSTAYLSVGTEELETSSSSSPLTCLRAHHPSRSAVQILTHRWLSHGPYDLPYQLSRAISRPARQLSHAVGHTFFLLMRDNGGIADLESMQAVLSY